MEGCAHVGWLFNSPPLLLTALNIYKHWGLYTWAGIIGPNDDGQTDATHFTPCESHTQSSAEIFLHLCIGCPHVYDYTSQYIVCTFWAERSMMVGTEKSFDFHATVLLIMKRVPNGVQSRAWCAAGQKCNRISLLSHIYIRREVLFFFPSFANLMTQSIYFDTPYLPSV